MEETEFAYFVQRMRDEFAAAAAAASDAARAAHHAMASHYRQILADYGYPFDRDDDDAETRTA